ncbi:MAG: hypothetical protein ABL892_11845 [Thiobacillaceae bacterium]
MQLNIPYLFPPARLLETAAQGLRLPALETLIARGTLRDCPGHGVEATLCDALGIVRNQGGFVEDYPVAPITLTADGGVAGSGYWLRADPVHLRVMRDRIVLADGAALELSQDEAAALTHSIASHFGAAFSPSPLHPRRWYVAFDTPPRLLTTPLSYAVGRDIDPLLPTGEDAMKFRTLLNELQMLLFEHPVNQAREARGELPVNSLWLWGGGTLPVMHQSVLTVHSDDADARALAQFCAAKVRAMPTGFSADLLAENNLILLNQLTDSGQLGDAYGWREAIGALERDWFAPVLGSLRGLNAEGLQLLDPVNGYSLHLTRADAWKFWHRPRALL